MTAGRRLVALLLAMLVIGAPAIVLNIVCVGDSCAEPALAQAEIPFCPLPAEMRALLENGFYKGRSPDVFAVAKSAEVRGSYGIDPEGASTWWPSPESVSATKAPLLLWGDGVTPGPLPVGTGIDQIAPTLASIIGLDRPHPEVRAGQPIEGAWKPAHPRLLLIIAVKGLGDDQGVPHPFFLGHSTPVQATTGSLPVDASASLATIGTGGLPSQHGITGSVVRNDQGEVVNAWEKGSPIPTIATLGDDLDHQLGEKPLIGMLGTDPSDRGLIGGNWYIGSDSDAFGKYRGLDSVTEMLAHGFGRDSVPDLLGIAIDVRESKTPDARNIVKVAEVASHGALTVAIVGTGSNGPDTKTGLTGAEIVDRIEQEVGAPVVRAAVPGGLFLDQQVLADQGMPAGRIVQAMKALTDPRAEGKVMLDSYPAFSVSFARYCDK